MSNSSKLYLFKRNNGIYYVGYFHEGKKRWKSTGCTQKSEATKSFVQFREFLNSKQSAVTLSKFIKDFIPFAKVNYSKCTVEFYEQSLERLKFTTKDCSLASITMQHLDQYKVNRISEQKSPSTVNRELQALRAAMNTAVNWKLIQANPFANMNQVQVPEVTPTYFSKQDFQALLNAISEEWLRELIVFAVLTGMRRGELINLRWQDVDLHRKLIHIQSNPTFKTKQGKKRVVPMNEVVYNLLHSKAEKARSEYIFNLKGFKINDDHASKKLKKYVAETKLDGKLHFHSLRHTFASWLVQDGVSLYEVQKLLGHSSIKVTQIYSHLQPEGLHSTVNKIVLN